jgi:energy-coupling factor transporter transmembrane protein EcfT
MFKINIISQLLIFFILAISINSMALNALSILSIGVAIALTLTQNNNFIHAILRFKWFFLVMVLIFSFNTPGEHVSFWPFAISPSYEGIWAGLTQILRVMLMLATLNLILACNTRQELISGFYFIFSPLKYFGLKIERFVARLWLTLHYVEVQNEANRKQDLMSQLKSMATCKPERIDQEENVILKVPQFSYLDFLVIVLLFLGLYVTKAYL